MKTIAFAQENDVFTIITIYSDSCSDKILLYDCYSSREL